MMMFMCKIAMLVLAILGYGALYKRLRLPTCFFPAALVSGISVTLYVFGFFSALQIGAYAVLMCGMLSLLLFRKEFSLKEFLSDWSILFCLIAGAWLYVLTRGSTFCHWDDGSHWYRICKSIYAEGAFPSTPDILFYNYVPGCQLWVYFVLRFIDFTTTNCMFAQGLISIACAASLFAGLRGTKTWLEKGFYLSAIALCTVTLCCMSTGTFTLMVDVQLGLTALALLILLLDQGKERGVCIPAVLLFSFLLLVKNSAVFFALVIFLWACIIHRWRGIQLLKRMVGCLGLPLVLRVVYTVRAGMVYAGAPESPQSVSLNRFAHLFSLKDAETLKLFVQRFFSKLFVGDTGLATAVYTAILLMVFVYFCLRIDNKKSMAEFVLKNLIIGFSMIAGYAVMLFCTYLFAMNVNEMTSVNSFYRYYGTVVIVFAGMSVYTVMSSCAFSGLGRDGVQRILVPGLLLFAVIAMPGAYPKRYIWGHGRYFIPDHYGPSLWYVMEYHVPENRTYSDLHYVAFWNVEDFTDTLAHNQYAEYALGAWLRSDHVDVISVRELREGLSQKQIEAIKACDRLVFMSDLTSERHLLAPYLNIDDLTVGMKSK